MSDFNLEKETVAFITKWYVWAVYVIVGVIAHISNMILSNKKKTFAQVMGSVGAALFVGYLASMYCIKNCPEQGAFIVPVATLSSEKILNGLTSINWKHIIDILFTSDKKP